MELLSIENLIALLTLTTLEIVLGIDNVIFISVLVGKLKPSQRELARKLGLLAAMFSRLLLLFAINWIMLLKEPWFELFGLSFSGRNLILLVGGLFLMGKATHEMHDAMEGPAGSESLVQRSPTFFSVILQILILDVVFSLDSVITAVGMAEDLWVMYLAVVIAVLVMLFFAKRIGDFIERRPTFKILALSFLLLVGMMLVLEGFGKHVEKAYIYFAIGFSLAVELVNCKIRDKHQQASAVAKIVT